MKNLNKLEDDDSNIYENDENGTKTDLPCNPSNILKAEND